MGWQSGKRRWEGEGKGGRGKREGGEEDKRWGGGKRKEGGRSEERRREGRRGWKVREVRGKLGGGGEVIVLFPNSELVWEGAAANYI